MSSPFLNLHRPGSCIAAQVLFSCSESESNGIPSLCERFYIGSMKSVIQGVYITFPVRIDLMIDIVKNPENEKAAHMIVVNRTRVFPLFKNNSTGDAAPRRRSD